MNKTLNDTQRKLVEDNHELIQKYLDRHHLDINATEDWYGTAAIGLCKAALDYDESVKISFSAMAYKYMSKEVKSIKNK